MYGKLTYDLYLDLLLCEFPISGKGGHMRTCREWRRNLGQHIIKQHKVTSKEYKKMMGLDKNLPLVSKALQKKWRKANQDQKLYLNLEKGKSYRFKKGKSTVQNYERSEQTKKRLRGLKVEKNK